MNILIVGANGGIGRAITARLCAQPEHRLLTTARNASGLLQGPNIRSYALDPCDDAQVADFFRSVDALDRIIVCTGMLHDARRQPEKTIRRFDADFLTDNIRANTVPALMIAKHAQRALKHGKQPVFATLSARVGSIGDNQLGGWYSYRASKAALNMAIKCLSIEWSRCLDNPIVVALHPGTVATALSEPFQSGVDEHRLFTPDYAAERLCAVIDALKPSDNGGFFAWDGQPIPW